jgi:hypothetical protein
VSNKIYDADYKCSRSEKGEPRAIKVYLLKRSAGLPLEGE